ncbi:hypothetical protein RFI_15930 [Reticulomyxa filosa]|uniref:Uncharacterized protein n=1 Tax=Reticulomyxa filosa TaxID=46433 RepID=X6N5R8_RETFI|nr:hypothetical protein RFI_15930 [Reticulomyxa filosa]|eukprot:ETO21273.1 hypothetical protein RFI_15930 [Reticulomyxa filosa]
MCIACANGKALHGYVLQMLWDIYHHDQRDSENGSDSENGKDKNNETTNDDNDDDNDVMIRRASSRQSDPIESKDNSNGNADANANANANTKSNDTNDDDKDDESFDEGDFILKPNFSKEAEDQWNITKFFDNHPKWSDFFQVLTHEMEVQTSADTQVPALGAQGTDDLSALMNNIISDGADDNENDDGNADGDSSDSDVCWLFCSLSFVRVFYFCLFCSFTCSFD